MAVILRQLASPLIYLLAAAAGLALLLGHPSDAVVILVVVVINTAVGAIHEGRAERSLIALRRIAALSTRVRRAGQDQMISAGGLVPGDLVLLAAGDAVTADARLLSSSALQTIEAALTGESLPAAKEAMDLPTITPLADRGNMVFAGTHVAAGRGRAVVVATGARTEVGRIASLAERAVEPPTPMEQRIDRLGRVIVAAAIVLFVAVVALGWLRGIPLAEIALIGVSQMVSLVPEGLPVALTVALAVGVQRMSVRGAIIRRLAAVETLGATTVICTDKTGTLTRGEMTVTAFCLPGGRKLEVTGDGYRPDGAFLEGGRAIEPGGDSDLIALLEAGVLCNDANVSQPDSDHRAWRAVGDPTEAALITAALKADLVPREIRARQPRLAEIPFDPIAKLMATMHGPTNRPVVILKGALEKVLPLCLTARIDGDRKALTESLRERILAEGQAMADRALRVLAVAEVPDASIDGLAGFAPFRGRATLLGLIGELDPPRAEVAAALAECRTAGIRPVMVTGDHKATGLAIASALAISHQGSRALDGEELARLSGAELDQQIDRLALFARVEPSQKLRVVEAYQRAGHVVAMTGDGVNDAPALARADVGVAMGVSGTEVAKEASKMVITDDNFATIVAAVAEGRVVFRNVRKILLLFLSTAAAEVLVLIAAVMAGLPAPFAAVQILWNNLVTEGLITVNLAMEPAEGDEMEVPPVSRHDPLVTREMWIRIGLMTAAIAASTLGWFAFRIQSGVPFAVAQTETFTVLAVCEWFNVLNCRSALQSAFRAGLLRNRWLLGGLVLANLLQVAVVFAQPLNQVFHTVPIDLRQALAIGVVASPVLWIEELRKLVARRRKKPQSTRGFQDTKSTGAT